MPMTSPKSMRLTTKLKAADALRELIDGQPSGNGGGCEAAETITHLRAWIEAAAKIPGASLVGFLY
jgi:hypothetical protein